MLKFRSFLRGFAWFLPPYSLCHLRGWTWALNTFVWAHCGSNCMPYAYWKFRSPHCQESQGAFGTAVKYCKAPLPAGGKSLEKGMPERLSGKLLHKGCPGKCQHFSLPLAQEETQSCCKDKDISFSWCISWKTFTQSSSIFIKYFSALQRQTPQLSWLLHYCYANKHGYVPQDLFLRWSRRVAQKDDSKDRVSK